MMMSPSLANSDGCSWKPLGSVNQAWVPRLLEPRGVRMASSRNRVMPYSRGASSRMRR